MNRPTATASPDLASLLAASVAAWPERAAIIETVDSHPVVTSFAKLAAEVDRTRMRLSAHGLVRGDRLALWAENRREFLVWQFAAAAEGINVVGINTRYRVQELAHVLEQALPRLVVMPQQLLALDLVGLLREACERLAATSPRWPAPQLAVLRPSGGVAHPVDDDAVLPAYDVGAGAWWADEPVDGVPSALQGEAADLCMTFTTSGSTGMPKLAAHDQAAIATHAAAVADAVDLRPGDVVCCALPLTGVFSYVPAMAAVAGGAACLMIPVFEGAGTLALMRQHRATHVFGGDDLYLGLQGAWEKNPLDLPDWRLAGIASFVGRVEQLLPWLQSCSPAAMCGVYGSSEVFSLVSIRDVDSPSHLRHVGGGSLVSEEIRVRAADPVTGEVLPPGEVGVLQFRGYNVLQRYLRGRSEPLPPLSAEGYFDSGDLGSVDDDERSFTYEGRAGEALRLRGFLVQPAEIELFLIGHPAVEMVKVVGAERDGRPVAVAFVTAAAGQTVDTEELLSWCRDELAAFKVPERVIVIDTMPFTSGTNGSKIKAAELRRQAAELLAP